MTSKVSENNQTLQCCTISLFCIIIFKKTKTYGSEKTQHKVLKAIIFFFFKAINFKDRYTNWYAH